MSNNILIRIYSLLQTFPTAPSLCLWCRCFAAGLRVQNAINDLVIAFKRRQMWVFFYPTSTAMWQSITFTPQHASLDINQMFREVVPRIWKIHGFTGECIHVYAAGRLLPVLSAPSRLPPQTQHLTFLIADYTHTTYKTGELHFRRYHSGTLVLFSYRQHGDVCVHQVVRLHHVLRLRGRRLGGDHDHGADVLRQSRRTQEVGRVLQEAQMTILSTILWFFLAFTGLLQNLGKDNAARSVEKSDVC